MIIGKKSSYLLPHLGYKLITEIKKYSEGNVFVFRCSVASVLFFNKKNTFLFFLFLSFSTWADGLNDSQLSCLLEPSNRVRISSQVPGVVKDITAKRGDRVDKGQLLLRLEDEVPRTALAMAKAKFEYADRQLERNKDIVLKGYISDVQHHELIINKKLARLAVEEAEVLLKQQAIHSPIQGVIVERSVSVGEYIAYDPLFEIVSLDPLYAEIVLRAELYGTIETDMGVVLQLVGRPETTYKGVVKIVDPVIDAASSTFGVRVEMQNPGEKIPAGLNCRVFFGGQTAAESASIDEPAKQ